MILLSIVLVEPFTTRIFYYKNNDWNNDWNNDYEYNSTNDFYFNNGYSEDYDDIDYFRKADGKNHIQNSNTIHTNISLPAMSNQMFMQVKQTI